MHLIMKPTNTLANAELLYECITKKPSDYGIQKYLQMKDPFADTFYVRIRLCKSIYWMWIKNNTIRMSVSTLLSGYWHYEEKSSVISLLSSLSQSLQRNRNSCKSSSSGLWISISISGRIWGEEIIWSIRILWKCM